MLLAGNVWQNPLCPTSISKLLDLDYIFTILNVLTRGLLRLRVKRETSNTKLFSLLNRTEEDVHVQGLPQAELRAEKQMLSYGKDYESGQSATFLFKAFLQNYSVINE